MGMLSPEHPIWNEEKNTRLKLTLQIRLLIRTRKRWFLSGPSIGARESNRIRAVKSLSFLKKVSFKECVYKYGGQEIDLISGGTWTQSGSVVTNLQTLVETKTSTSNRKATFELVGFNVNDVQGGIVSYVTYVTYTFYIYAVWQSLCHIAYII